jgi:hypothetical protein
VGGRMTVMMMNLTCEKGSDVECCKATVAMATDILQRTIGRIDARRLHCRGLFVLQCALDQETSCNSRFRNL